MNANIEVTLEVSGPSPLRLFLRPRKQIKAHLIDNNTQSFTLVSDAIHFWLPPEQSMFPPRSQVHTPSHYIEEGVTQYQTVSGHINRQMSYSIDPRKSAPLGDDLKIGGILNGKLYVNLVEGI